MIPNDIIRIKRNKREIPSVDLKQFIWEYSHQQISDKDMTKLLKAIFKNGMTREEIFALTESMISSLSRYTGITVLSSSTSFGILKKELLDEEIKKDFNVSFIFQGSIQSFGENTRLIVELNDLSKNKVVWSDRFDFKLDDIFKIQDEIGNKVLGELQINAVMGQYAKKLKSEFDTFDQYLLYTNFHSLWNKQKFLNIHPIQLVKS